MNIRKKGCQSLKLKNLPCLLLTNHSLGMLYPDTSQRELFEARVEFVELSTRFPLDELEFYERIWPPAPPPLPLIPLTQPSTPLVNYSSSPEDYNWDWSPTSYQQIND